MVVVKVWGMIMLWGGGGWIHHQYGSDSWFCPVYILLFPSVYTSRANRKLSLVAETEVHSCATVMA